VAELRWVFADCGMSDQLHGRHRLIWLRHPALCKKLEGWWGVMGGRSGSAADQGL
jgi:hypothetical protein